MHFNFKVGFEDVFAYLSPDGKNNKDTDNLMSLLIVTCYQRISEEYSESVSVKVKVYQ